jgi:hypothetical protein
VTAQRLSDQTREAVLEALRRVRVARWVARDFGISDAMAYRLAKRHGIELISNSVHMRKRRNTPEFLARQVPAQRAAASAWLKEKHRDLEFARKVVRTARRNMKRLNQEPPYHNRTWQGRRQHNHRIVAADCSCPGSIDRRPIEASGVRRHSGSNRHLASKGGKSL